MRDLVDHTRQIVEAGFKGLEDQISGDWVCYSKRQLW